MATYVSTTSPINNWVHTSTTNIYPTGVAINWDDSTKSTPRKFLKESSLAKVFRTFRRECAQKVVATHDTSIRINDVDAERLGKLLVEKKSIYNGKPRKELMNLLNSIHGIGKATFLAKPEAVLTYHRPHIVGHSRRKAYLTHAGFKVLDMIAESNETFARFLAAYDNKAMRKRAAEECTMLLLGVVPPDMEKTMADNKVRIKIKNEKQYEADRLKYALEYAKMLSQTRLYQAAPTPIGTGLPLSITGVSQSLATNKTYVEFSDGNRVEVDPVTWSAVKL